VLEASLFCEIYNQQTTKEIARQNKKE